MSRRFELAYRGVLACCFAAAALCVVGAATAFVAAPEAPTAEAQSFTDTSAFLHGVLNPGIEPPQEGTYEFLYAASPTTCTGEHKGARGLALGFGAQEVGEEIGGLAPHTTYTVCLLDRNLAGEETLSAVHTFTTSFEPEAPETGTPSPVAVSAATLHGVLNPNGGREAEPGFYEFLYKRSGGECEGEGSTGQIQAVTGKEKEAVQSEVTGLAPGSQYTVCLRAWNTTGQFVTGSPVTFTTLPERPSVGEEKAANVATRSADVSAPVTTGGLPVTYTVQYGTTNSYGQETSPLEVGAESSTVGVSLSGLEPGSEYHYRFHVKNTQGEQDGADATFMTLASPVTVAGGEGACPNEALRSELGDELLPDCRAYEQVTPEFKAGYRMNVFGYSTDGEQAILSGLDGIAGTPGGAENGTKSVAYLAKRTAGGWQLSPLNPSPTELVALEPIALEAQSGASLWEAHTPRQSSSTIGLYARSVGDPHSSFIGPLFPSQGPEEPSNVIITPSGSVRVVGATHDYEHVLIGATTSRYHWSSFDDTVNDRESLYEYSGRNNSQPILVGVSGSKGSNHLIGVCGIELGGGGFHSVYNALSSDGETVFFSVRPSSTCGGATPAPATTELYARRHGSLASPLEAEEFHVSASECTTACGSEESGKSFVGASEDGQNVFFTSTQKLTDDAVDGIANGDASGTPGCAITTEAAGGCNLYEYDLESKSLQVLAAGGVVGVPGIAADGSRVYFVSRAVITGTGENEYGKVPKLQQPNLYVYDTASGTTHFIVTLGDGDEFVWNSNPLERAVQVAGTDGRFLLFASATEGLTPDDHSSLYQLFEYDALSGELVRITKGEDGYNEDGNGVSEGIEPFLFTGLEGAGSDFKPRTNIFSMASDGKTVFFPTVGQLSPRASSAASGCTSLYEFHTNGALSQGTVSLVSDGSETELSKGRCGPPKVAIDEDGANVLFVASDPLVPGDADGLQPDIYDARVGGGFPLPISAGSCEGEGCQGASSVAPVFGAPASVTVSGAGNLVPSLVAKKEEKSAVKCRKGSRLSHGRCVKVKRGRRASAGRAGSNRGVER